ncbi:hypothetical protein LXL04_031040 [Taraxacum kok-saghyz]
MILTSIGFPFIILKGFQSTSTSVIPMVCFLSPQKTLSSSFINFLWLVKTQSLLWDISNLFQVSSPTSSVLPHMLPMVSRFSKLSMVTGSPTTFNHASLLNSSISPPPYLSSLNHLRHVFSSSRNFLASAGSLNLMETPRPLVYCTRGQTWNWLHLDCGGPRSVGTCYSPGIAPMVPMAHVYRWRGVGIRMPRFGNGRMLGGFLGNLASTDNELSNSCGSFISSNLIKQKNDPSLFFLSGMKTSTTLPRGLNFFQRSPFLMPTGMFDTYRDVRSGKLLCGCRFFLRRTFVQPSSLPP